MEAYGTGKIHQRTLQPRRSRLDVFNLEHFLRDWETNNISDGSFRCMDLSFFDDTPAGIVNSNANSTGDQNIMDMSDRHGTYLYSSKDWHQSKDQIVREEKEAYKKQVEDIYKNKTE